MLVTHEREKLADAIIYFVENTKYCGLTKLFKLLFFLDFIHFRETGQRVTGLNYVTWEHGPAPDKLWREIKNGLQPDLAKAVLIEEPIQDDERKPTKITPLRKFDGQHLTRRAKGILEELAFIFQEVKADKIVEISHLRGQPWEKTKREKGLNQRIDPRLSLDGFSDQELDKDELAARLEEMREARDALK